MIRLPLNNQVLFKKPAMRERSGGVHCESYEELMDILDSHAHHCPTCPNIDDFLRDQESNNLDQSAQSDYFFEPLRQLQQEEQNELERTLQSDLSCRLVRTEIAIICHQLQNVLWELLDRKGIHQFYSVTSFPSTQTAQSVYVAVDGSTVSVSLRSIDVCPQIEARSGENEWKDEVRLAKEGEAKLSSLNDSEPRQNRLLQLVIYYNRVQQGQTLPNQQSLSSPKSVFQHKIWLVQETDDYKQLLSTYTDSAQFLFKATRNPTPLSDLKNTIYQQIRPAPTSSRCQAPPTSGGCVLRDVLCRVEAVRESW